MSTIKKSRNATACVMAGAFSISRDGDCKRVDKKREVMMAKKLVFLVSIFFVVSCFGSIESEKVNQPYIYNLIMIMDVFEYDRPDLKILAFSLQYALCQQESPILVTEQTFIITLKANKTTLPLDKWLFYYAKNGLILCVPLTLLAKAAEKFERISVAAATGFDVQPKKFIMLKELNTKFIAQLPESEMDSLFNSAKKILGDEPGIQNKKKILTQEVQNLFSVPANGLWNIYLLGHGMYPNTKNRSDLRLSETAEQQRKEKLFQDFFVEHQKQVDLKDWRIVIAGFEVDEYKKMINFFTQIQTNFLYVSSCYAGGANLLLPYTSLLVNEQGSVLSTLNPKFYIVMNSITDAAAYTTTTGLGACYEDSSKIPSGIVNFQYFFSELAAYTEQFLANKPTIVPVRLNNDQLQKVLAYAASSSSALDPAHIQGVVYIMFPGTQAFVPFAVDPGRMFIISATKIRAAQEEKKPIIVQKNSVKKREGGNLVAQNIGPEILLLPVADIPVQIDIKTPDMPAVVSLLPGIGLHTIESIDASAIRFKKFLDGFCKVETIFSKYFLINKLVVSNDVLSVDSKMISLSSVIIAVNERRIHGFFLKEKELFYCFNIVFSPANIVFIVRKISELSDAQLQKGILVIIEDALQSNSFSKTLEDFEQEWLKKLSVDAHEQRLEIGSRIEKAQKAFDQLFKLKNKEIKERK